MDSRRVTGVAFSALKALASMPRAARSVSSSSGFWKRAASAALSLALSPLGESCVGWPLMRVTEVVSAAARLAVWARAPTGNEAAPALGVKAGRCCGETGALMLAAPGAPFSASRSCLALDSGLRASRKSGRVPIAPSMPVFVGG